MKCLSIGLLAVLCLSASACGNGNASGVVEAPIVKRDGGTIGSVRLEQGTKGVIMTVDVGGLEPGKHGMHFHQVGTCDDAQEGFKASGGHIAPSGKPHGLRNKKGPHAGDLPNLIVGADGTATVEIYTDFVSLKDGGTAILDENGSALVIHANPDDHRSQPIGGAGERVACAAFKPEKK